MNRTEVNSVVRKFRKMSLSIIAGLSLLFLLLSNLLSEMSFINGILVGASFSLFFSMIYLEVWKFFATNNPHATTKFYLLSMSFRFLLGSLTVLLFCLFAKTRESIIHFMIAFSAYYLVMMIFETAYFVGVEQRRIK